ncbi:hypothetical protein NQ314_006950 [Rhamnusium bicolor]|uniref:PiggyBac transposable element-derived protein domain-containing protein n=1 Tax=Rhamnusium bicolor TaxID=1586634 RepID=A0AAV8YVR3_9CUCU|nr:hypothetical protein NQ314_006950 [Rhamnusium bicolor]
MSLIFDIADVMPVNKFEKIRQYIHFNDHQTFIPCDHPGHDRLHKIRNSVDYLNKKCYQLIWSSISVLKNKCTPPK